MRRNRFWGALFVILALMTVRCTSELPEPDIPASRTETVSIDEVPGLLEAIAPYVNPSFLDRGNISSANQGETYFGMNIDFEHIMAQMDSMQYTNYSFLLDDGDADEATFANLVVGRDSIGQYHPPLLIQYEMTSEFAQQYFETGSFEGFTGNMTRAQLAIPTNSSQQNDRTSDSEDPGDYGSDRDQPSTTCPQTTPMSGGEPYTPSDPGGSTGTTTWEVCEVIVHTGTRILADGTYTTYWFTTYENCYTMEVPTLTSSDSDGTCSNPDGEVPINTPDPEPNPEVDPCKTSSEDIGKAYPNATKAAKDSLASIINELAEKFGIDSKEKLQHFLGQAAHESGGFTDLTISEGLYYTTASVLANTFSSKFSLTDTVNKKHPNDYLRDSKKLANFVYANKNGNGDEASGDGYRFRGRGIFQLTGRYNYSKFNDFWAAEFPNDSKNFLTNPDLIGTNDRIAIISALWYYKTRVLDKITVDDETSVDTVTKKINAKKKGLQDRKDKTKDAADHIDDCDE